MPMMREATVNPTGLIKPYYCQRNDENTKIMFNVVSVLYISQQQTRSSIVQAENDGEQDGKKRMDS